MKICRMLLEEGVLQIFCCCQFTQQRANTDAGACGRGLRFVKRYGILF